MSDFDTLFVELCSKEPSLYDPSHASNVDVAVGRISMLLGLHGFATFGPGQVKPMFDRVRAFYEVELANRVQGRESELKWFHSMDAYMRPFVRRDFKDPSTCSNDVSGAEETTTDMDFEDDDTPCDVCRSRNPEVDNEMIFCNSCNVCVHQACYGVPVVPQDDWYCRPCQLNISPTCVLCPKDKGAMKSTSDGQDWAHVSCAWWIPEVRIECPMNMEPISDIKKIPVSRWNLVCSLCRVRRGACIQCVECSCTVAYHVTCAFENGLKMDMHDDPEQDNLKLQSYCRKHSTITSTLKSGKKKARKKKIRRGSKDVGDNCTAPRKIRLPSCQMNISETVTSILNENEVLEAEIGSDSSNQRSGVNSSSLTQSSRKQNKRREQESLRRFIYGLRPLSKHASEAQTSNAEEGTTLLSIPNEVPISLDGMPMKTMTSKTLNGTGVGEKATWNTETTALQLSKESFQGSSNGPHIEHQTHTSHETLKDADPTKFDPQPTEGQKPQHLLQAPGSYEPPTGLGITLAPFNNESYGTKYQHSDNSPSHVKAYRKRGSFNGKSPAKKIRLSESSGKQLSITQIKKEFLFDSEPTASHTEHIHFDNDLSVNQQTSCYERPHATPVTLKTIFDNHYYAVQHRTCESFIESINNKPSEPQLTSNNFGAIGQDGIQTYNDIPSSSPKDAQSPTMQGSYSSSHNYETSPTKHSEPEESLIYSQELESEDGPLSFENLPPATQDKHCDCVREGPCTTRCNNVPSFKHKSSGTQLKLSTIKVKRRSPSRNQSSAAQEEHWMSSTSEAEDIYDPHFREQPISSSFLQKETTKSKSETEEHSKKVDYQQFAKFINVCLRNVSPKKAMCLQRKIVSLCLKSQRKKHNSNH